MKIIVTGGLGHIGSHLIRNLSEEFKQAKIIIIDNLMTQRYCSLFNLKNKERYFFIKADVIKDNLEFHFKDTDYVVHLAAITDAANSFNNAEEVEMNNYEATKKVANYCSKYGCKLVTLSSTSVYGTNDQLVDENAKNSDLKPQSPYAKTKLKEESFILNNCKKNNLKGTIFRFGTIFGTSPGIRFHTAVNKFCLQAAWDEPLTIWKTAYYQVRPYLDIDDASRAIIHLIKENIFNGDIFNILTFNASVSQIVEEIRKYKNVEIKKVDSKIMNQLSYEVSTEKFIKTGFKYTGSLEKGIKNTMKLLGVIS
tara:strand:- start:619 stop:1548 length:930 start_codon:yes stop_codon:yes gene_type:complete